MKAPVTSRGRRPQVVAVIEDDCTGCNTCVDYCLVDCIEPAAPSPNLPSLSAVTVREDECIGCSLCAKVCDELGVNAVRLVATQSE